VPFSVSASPAPLTFTVWPNWKSLLYGSLGLIGFAGFYFFTDRIPKDTTRALFLAIGGVTTLYAMVRRERIEIYPDSITFRKLYLGIPTSKSVRLDEVLGLEWNEGNDEGKDRSPSYLEFYTTLGSIKAGFSLSFEEYEKFREEVRMLYPQLDSRWGNARVRSKHLTLLNLQ
jgi:hypothetical protein